MNILVYSSTYLPVTGGLQYLLFWLMTEFDRGPTGKHKNVNIILYIPKYDLQEYTKFKKIQTIESDKNPTGILNKLSVLSDLFKIVKRNDVDLVVCWDAVSDGPLIMVLNKLTNVPFIVSCHGQDIACNKAFDYGARRNLLKKIIVSLVLKAARAVSTISSDMREVAVDAGAKRNKVTVIPNGIPNNSEKVTYDDIVTLKSKYHIHDKAIVMLTLSGHRPIKGHLKLLDAFSKAVNVNPNLILIIGAESDFTKTIKNRAYDLGLEESVRFIGFVHDAEKRIWYTMANIYANTAYFEPFGLTYLEAIQYDCAVLASIYGGARDIFRHKESAYIIDPYSVSSIEQGINYLAQDENNLYIRKNAKPLLSKYNLSHIARLYIDYFKAVANT